MKNKVSILFTILLSLNITFLLISNIITFKLVNVGLIIFTAADLLFPFTYILGDVFTEVYGYSKAKLTIIMSFLCNFIMVIIFQIAIILPYPEYFQYQDSFATIFSTTPRILLASFIAYLVGSFANAKVMDMMKKRNTKLYQRTILSTIVGELLDSVLFIMITFLGTYSFSQLFTLIITIYILKVMIEIIFTPITYFVINKIKKWEEKYE